MSPIRVNSSRGGWTLLEALIATVLGTLVIAKSVTMMKLSGEVTDAQSEAMILEDNARLVMNRIGVALMGADREQLIPTIEELHSSGVRYRFSLGVDVDGTVQWSDEEKISLEEAGSSVQWFQSPEMPEERRVVWTNLVQPLLEGEVMNGIDDNGNGLVDEEGLSFVLDGDAVRIRLSLQRPGSQGEPLIRSIESVVTCRN